MSTLQGKTADIICSDVGSRTFPEYQAARMLYSAVNHYGASVPETVVAARCVWQLICGEPIPEHELCEFFPYTLPETHVYSTARAIVSGYIPQDASLHEMADVIAAVHETAGTTDLQALLDDKRAAVLFNVCYPERGFQVISEALDATMERCTS